MDTETNAPAIRQATVRDAEGVVNVINSVIQEGGLTALYPALTVEAEERFIRGLGSRSALFVAEADGGAGSEIVGLQTIAPLAEYTRAMDHVAEIGTFVYRDYRRQGVGRLLFEHTLAFARQRGYEKLMLSVRAGNASALDFYRQMGFVAKLVLERQVKIEGQYDDQVLMERFIALGDQAAGAVPRVVEEPAVVAKPDGRPPGGGGRSGGRRDHRAPRQATGFARAVGHYARHCALAHAALRGPRCSICSMTRATGWPCRARGAG